MKKSSVSYSSLLEDTYNWSPEEEKKEIESNILINNAPKFSNFDENYKPIDPKISTNLTHKEHNFAKGHNIFKFFKTSDKENTLKAVRKIYIMYRETEIGMTAHFLSEK